MGKHTVIGSGIYYLDTIVVRDYPDWPRRRPFTERTVLEEVGGTCGNVCCMLSHFGWDALPQASLDDSPEGLRMRDDLARYGCDCRFVTNTPEGGTSLLRCTHGKDAEGRHVMGVRAGAPGGSRFPKRHFLRMRDEAPAFVAAVRDWCPDGPDVYFFDSPAAGHRYIARALRESGGTLVFFEPDRVADNAELECVELSDVVKFSSENIPDASFADRYTAKLFIQTLGADGLRFKLGGTGWVALPPVPCGDVVDTEGAGDWLTSAFLDALGRTGPLRLEGRTQDEVAGMLREAQECSARSIGFMGSKGMINH